MANFILGVTGGSGSGKSTVTEHIVNVIGNDKVAVVMQDYYYKDLSHLSMEERSRVNFDHPDAFDWDLLRTHLENLYNGIPVEMPIYDFTTHSRTRETKLVVPASVVIFEGIYALYDAELRKCMSLKIFVDTAADIRFIRRQQRDMVERARTPESIIRQYLDYVRPMHKQFIEPTKQYSDIIIPNGANKAALEMIVARVNVVLHTQQSSILDNSFVFRED